MSYWIFVVKDQEAIGLSADDVRFTPNVTQRWKRWAELFRASGSGCLFRRLGMNLAVQATALGRNNSMGSPGPKSVTDVTRPQPC